MPKTVKAGGKTITVPDDATDEEISQILNPPQEGAFTRFMHGAGLPGTSDEYKSFLPSGDFQRGTFDEGTLMRGMLSPEESKTAPAATVLGGGTPYSIQRWPLVGPMFRASAETMAKPGIMPKVYGAIPFVGPVAEQMGEDINTGDYAGAAGSGLNIATQMLGLRPKAPAIAEAAHDVAAPVVRGVAKGANKTLERAPGTVGAGLGAAAAHEVGLPPWVGAGAGYGLGREILPRLRVPGEKFGLGPRMPMAASDADAFLRSPGIEGDAVKRAAKPTPFNNINEASERGTWSADPRTQEQILEDVRNSRGGGQGKVAMRVDETTPAAPAPRSSRPGFGTAEVPIEERMDMSGFYGKTPTRHSVDASNIFTPRAMEAPRFVPKEEMTPEDYAFQDQNMEDILAASVGQRRLQNEIPRPRKK